MSILLDSDIVIEVMRAKDQALLAKWSVATASNEDILFSPVTAAEIWAGARPNEHPGISGFFRRITCASADYKIGQMAGEFLRQYAKSHGVEIADALVSATTIQNRAVLWTRNRKHYPMPSLSFYS
jgi:predicted nucleic acid-binding protein